MEAVNIRETCDSIETYLNEVSSQEPVCDTGVSGIVTWIPDDNTPNIVYYQVHSN